ncbi:VOC family protein [Nocardia sp. NBC_01327]|uniref:VOC family protein n=1 Tax=Nocardia sp. NBC_01327 TaxID=2903593 RepID=UPI002E10545E|nr:VOC family protein [Nocardia sp. NBC_01327]
MKDVFARAHHVCIVVADVRAAIDYYEGIGIGGWQDYPDLSEYDNKELSVPDRKAFLGLKYVYTNVVAGLQLQLVEPGPGDTPQRNFLDRTGGGVFHIGFNVEDIDKSTGTVQEAGISILMSGRRKDRTGFTYFDTAVQAGVVLEIRH